ncbi:MAG: sulfotransferase, partial [Oscillochloris sp.]|nr:sulfotransferase [Oscillochloris sp.]
ARLARSASATATLDGVIVSPDLPEEYGFLLEDGPQPRLRALNRARMEQICATIAAVSPAGRPLLLKNPWDYAGNFRLVKSLFPAAKFIFLLRDPLAVVNSQLRAVREMLGEPNPYAALLAPWYARLLERPRLRRALHALYAGPTGLRITRRHVARAAAYHIANIGALPADDVFTLRYEDLCAAPQRWVERMVRFSRTTAARCAGDEPLIAPRRAELLPEVQRNAARIRGQLRAYCAWYGY